MVFCAGAGLRAGGERWRRRLARQARVLLDTRPPVGREEAEEEQMEKEKEIDELNAYL